MNFWCMGILLHIIPFVLAACTQLARLSSLLVGVNVLENWMLFAVLETRHVHTIFVVFKVQFIHLKI